MREEVGDTKKIIHNTCMQQKDAYVSGVCFFSLCRALLSLSLSLAHTLCFGYKRLFECECFCFIFYLFIVCIYASNCCLPFVNAMMLLGLCLNWRSKTIEAKQILKLIVGAPCLLVLYSSSERLQSVSLCLCLRCWRCCRVVFGSHGWHGIPNVHTEEADHPTNRPPNRPSAMQSQTSNHIKQIFVVFSRIFSLIALLLFRVVIVGTYLLTTESLTSCVCHHLMHVDVMWVCMYVSISQ